jgi:hypothetical protein
MLNVEKGQQVLTPLGHIGTVLEVSTINQVATGTRGLSKAKVRYSPVKGTVNESWFPFGKLKEVKFEPLIIPDEEAFIIEPEHVNPETTLETIVVKEEPTDDTSL